jgi:hypothetical protein
MFNLYYDFVEIDFSPRVALTTEYRLSLSHRLNMRLPDFDFTYASLSRTLLKKRAVRFTRFLLVLFSTSILFYF